jgi:hypothetical protein
MKDSFLKEIKERRSRDMAVLEELQNQIQELTNEAALIEQTINTYDALLGGTGAVRGRKGRPPAKVSGKRGRPKGSGGRGGTKTSAVISIISKLGDKGASPGEVFDGVQNMGIKDFTKPYVYTVLHKLKGRNKLREKGGRYFLPR